MSTSKKRFSTRQKFCWVATETNKGWRLTFAAGKNYNVVGLLLIDMRDIPKVLGDVPCVYVHLRNSKTVGLLNEKV